MLFLKIRNSTIYKYLKKFLEKPKKISQAFYLFEKYKSEKIKFCKILLEKRIE